MILALLLSSFLAHAAQDGRILKSEVTVHESPDAASPVLNRVGQGESLRMAAHAHRGWFKVQLPQPIGMTKYGYVAAADIEPDTADADLRHAGIIKHEPIERESSQRHWLLRGYYEFVVLTPTTLTTLIGSGSPLAFGHVFGGEFGYTFENGIFFGLRGGYTLAGMSVSTGNFSASAVLTSLIFDYEAVYHYPFAFNVGMSLGAAYLGTISGTDSAGAAITGSYSVAPEGTIRFAGTVYLGASFGISLGVGFQGLYAPVATLNASSSQLWLGGGFGHGALVVRF